MPNEQLTEDFFSEQTEASRIKSSIVSKYLDGWSLILSSWAPKMVYADFFAGCGRYENGSPSTPLEAITNITNRSRLKDKVQMIFNEFNTAFYQQLRENILAHDNISALRYAPIIQNQSFQERPALEQLRLWLQLHPSERLPPILAFVDPWGYKGLSLKHFGEILVNNGCEVIFFFNYNRINSALSNPVMKKNMTLLFGEEKADQLRRELALIRNRPHARETIILQAVKNTIKQLVQPKKSFVQDFRFMKGNRVSHYVIFATTHPKGYGLMKEIMALQSASYQDGIPVYQYTSIDSGQMALFNGVTSLSRNLLQTFTGQTIRMEDIYDKHQITGPYIKRNYKDALLLLEETSQVTTSPSRDSRRLHRGKPTMGEGVMVTFP